ncbi:gastrula-specific protein 17-like [Rhinoderma darwinii]|uniref:gastrula-specific protein 17-like n=1 Tax=Rhinoderma darwinii TaxID=43563 RepID=UPI003F66EF6D
MPQHWKSPQVTGIREGGTPPYLTPSQRNISPKTWSSPHQNWNNRNRSATQCNWSPQHYNSYSHPNGYWGSQQQWSPNRWDPAYNYHRSWGSTPRTLQFSPFHTQSPVHGSAYTERKTQAHFKNKRGNHKDISNYYSPSMVEDPWAELEAKAKSSAKST